MLEHTLMCMYLSVCMYVHDIVMRAPGCATSYDLDLAVEMAAYHDFVLLEPVVTHHIFACMSAYMHTCGEKYGMSVCYSYITLLLHQTSVDRRLSASLLHYIDQYWPDPRLPTMLCCMYVCMFLYLHRMHHRNVHIPHCDRHTRGPVLMHLACVRVSSLLRASSYGVTKCTAYMLLSICCDGL
jgi:hypothetical protein